MVQSEDQAFDSMLKGAEEMDKLHKPKKKMTWHKTIGKILVAIILFIPRLLLAVLSFLLSPLRKQNSHLWE